MRKISAHYIITNTSKPLKYGIIYLDDNSKIIDIIDTKGELIENEKTEFFNGIICPGFVNAHCHLELSHLKNKIPKQSGLVNFIKTILSHKEKYSAEIILNFMEKAEIMMTKNGIVAVGDLSNSFDSITIKKNNKIYYHTFIELLGVNENDAEKIFHNGENKLRQIFLKNNLSCSLTPHSPYSVSKTLFLLIQKKLAENPNILSIHNQESKEENEIFSGKENKLSQFLNTISPNTFNKTKSDYLKNKSSLQVIFPYIEKAKKILLVHNTYTTEKDIQSLKNHLNKIYWILCSKSNLYIENKLPFIDLIRKHSENIAIGTDSLASNDSLSILDELKTISKNFPDIELSELVKWGTINGAKALEIEAKFGSIEIGKKPGINLLKNIDLNNFKLKAETTVEVLA